MTVHSERYVAFSVTSSPSSLIRVRFCMTLSGRVGREPMLYSLRSGSGADQESRLVFWLLRFYELPPLATGGVDNKPHFEGFGHCRHVLILGFTLKGP